MLVLMSSKTGMEIEKLTFLKTLRLLDGNTLTRHEFQLYQSLLGGRQKQVIAF
jgi:hypothetical protein